MTEPHPLPNLGLRLAVRTLAGALGRPPTVPWYAAGPAVHARAGREGGEAAAPAPGQPPGQGSGGKRRGRWTFDEVHVLGFTAEEQLLLARVGAEVASGLGLEHRVCSTGG